MTVKPHGIGEARTVPVVGQLSERQHPRFSLAVREGGRQPDELALDRASPKPAIEKARITEAVGVRD
jgi:hypothetical protein